MPFVSIARERAKSRYKDDFAALAREMRYSQPVLKRNDEVGGVARHLAWELRDVLRRPESAERLHVEYQPKVRKDGRVQGAEALIRWAHPDFGYISPPVILGLADEAGLHVEFGRWVIRQAVRNLAAWRLKGFTDIRLSINLSPSHINGDPNLGAFICEITAEAGVPLDALEFELTENAVIDESDKLHSTLRGIREAGSDISIDDFGMGHSSLKYIFDFCANVVKLDASLVQGAVENEDVKTVVRAILELCGKLGVHVVAEGVETKQELELISELGAQTFQGWYFSKAIPAEEFERYMKEHGTVGAEDAERADEAGDMDDVESADDAERADEAEDAEGETIR